MQRSSSLGTGLPPKANFLILWPISHAAVAAPSIMSPTCEIRSRVSASSSLCGSRPLSVVIDGKQICAPKIGDGLRGSAAAWRGSSMRSWA